MNDLISGSLLTDRPMKSRVLLLPVFAWRHVFGFFKRFRKIQTAFKADGIGNGRDRQAGMTQQIAGLLDTEAGKILFGRYLQHRFKRTKQMTAA